MKVTVPSVPNENGVPGKINVILLRFPQANLFLTKIIVLDFSVPFICLYFNCNMLSTTLFHPTAVPWPRVLSVFT